MLRGAVANSTNHADQARDLDLCNISAIKGGGEGERSFYRPFNVGEKPQIHILVYASLESVPVLDLHTRAHNYLSSTRVLRSIPGFRRARGPCGGTCAGWPQRF